MKLKKKLKPKLIDEIKTHQQYRKKLIDYIDDFRTNTYNRYKLMMKLITMYKQKEITSIEYQLSAGLYVSSLISCWETVFRDMISFVVNNDELLTNKVNKFLIEKGMHEDDIKKADITIGEFFCKQFNFQDISEVNSALNYVFDLSFENIGQYADFRLIPDVGFNSPNIFVYWLSNDFIIENEVMDTLREVIEIRHKVIHDSNFRLEIDPEFMSILEDVIIIVPQLLSIKIATKYGLDMFLTTDDQALMRCGRVETEKDRPLVFSKRDYDAKYTKVN